MYLMILEKKILWQAGPYKPVLLAKNRQKQENHDFCQGYAALGPYCYVSYGGIGGPIFLFSDF
jgi:hypothetical protein